MLDEACRVMRGLWTEKRFSFEGEHYQLKDAQMDPKPVQEHMPLVIGGSGERRTLRIVAEHGDIWNSMFGDMELFEHKLDVLSQHCADVGRDPADIRKSVTFRAVLAEDDAGVQERRKELEAAGPSRFEWFVGTPDQFVDRLKPWAERGAGDFLLGASAPYDWQTIELIARQVAPALRAEVAA
jgi:alkanesulfonate monooxygenase SsuD/methylene tetrahydromethanopterin reductase-like flavin-dependent oxidoreductase (luciferase family)